MGQKVNPIGLRLGVTRTWSSVWYSHRNYAKWLHEDVKLREAIKKEFYAAGVSHINIERSGDKVKVTLHAAKPGIIVGKQGAGIEKIKQIVSKLAKGAQEIFVQPEEVKKPEINAQLVSESIAEQIEKRAHFRRVMKRAMGNAIKSGVEGIKVQGRGCDKLRGSAKQLVIRRFPNGATRQVEDLSTYAEFIGVRGEPGELKHLSTLRKRKSIRFPQ